jgi:hypothetical protein
MATDADGYTLGVGCELRYWDKDAGVPSWVKLSKIRNIDPSGKTKEILETTDLDATNRYVTKKGGFIDPGNITFTMEFTRDQYDKLNTQFESVDSYNYEIVAPDDENSAWEFVGIVSELPLPSMNPKETMKMDVTVEISGKPETESGSGSS